MATWHKRGRPSDLPSRLVTFHEADWGVDDGEAMRQFIDARRAWCIEHGFSYPGHRGEGADLPDGPLGDVIDQLNAERAVRRNWPGP